MSSQDDHRRLLLFSASTILVRRERSETCSLYEIRLGLSKRLKNLEGKEIRKFGSFSRGHISWSRQRFFGNMKSNAQPRGSLPKCEAAALRNDVFPDCGGKVEEDGGFGICGDKTRYATLQKKRVDNNSLVVSPRGYETMRNLRTSIPSLVSTIKHHYS